MFGELLPNLWSTIIVFFTLNIAANMLFESALSFLGAGVRPPTSSWGSMSSQGFTLLTSQPQLVTIPGLMILLTVLALNVFGDGLRDALDPKSKITVRARGGQVEIEEAKAPDGAIHRQAAGADGTGAVRGLGPRLPDLQRPARRRDRRRRPADRRQERHPAADRQREEGLRLRQVAARAVLDDDEADLLRDPGLLPEPAQRHGPDQAGHPGDLLAVHRRGDHLDGVRRPLRLPLRRACRPLHRPRADDPRPGRDLAYRCSGWRRS